MALSINRPPRRFTPKDLLREHPLAQGLVACAAVGDGAVDAVLGRVPSAFTGFSAKAGPYGPYAQMAQGSGNCISYPSSPYVPSGSKINTIAVLAAPVSTARLTIPLRFDDGGTSVVDFLFNSDTLGGPTAGMFSARWVVSNTYETSAQVASQINGAWRIFAATRNDSTTCNLYADGIDLVAGGTGAGGPGFNGTTFFACGHSAGDFAADYPVAWVWAWNRALVAAEHYRFALNPWQIFRPVSTRTTPKFGVTGAAVVGLLAAGASSGGSGGGIKNKAIGAAG